MALESRGAAGWYPTSLLGLLALWLATAGNLPLWVSLWQLSEQSSSDALWRTFSWTLMLWGAILAFIGLWVWPRWIKPAGLLLLFATTAASYFMYSYSVVIDPTMWANVVNTDVKEARDLLTWQLGLALLLGFALPGWWWWRQTLRPMAPLRLLSQQLGLVLGGLLLSAVVLWLGFQDMASLMRNHKSLRYMINPFNTVYAATRHGIGRASQVHQPLLTLGDDATLRRPVSQAGAAPLIVIVLGETARAANFGLAGYPRDTTPRLQQLSQQGQLSYFSQTSSCGTNTQTSVPCLFSVQTRQAYDPELRQENLLDVLQRAGLAVLWLDNQSGCKGVCDRVPHANVAERLDPETCAQGECHDEALLKLLPGELAKLDLARRAQGTVVVLHQMGSHGPAYYRRTPSRFKAFMPECSNTALQACELEQIVNAYDNTLRYTDHFLAETIAWLKQQAQPTALYYISDHGESLGEKGLFLHGLPYSMAPQEQTHVPMLMWFSPEAKQKLTLDTACLNQRAKQPASHDHVFHTVLGLADVVSRVYQSKLDLLADCRDTLRRES